MPNRILREGILTSPRVSKLGWTEEVFYRRLMSVVDDFGRYFADPGMLRASCYPRQLNKVSDSDVGKWLRACVDAALVRVYPAEDGESYLELINFGQQVRAKKSKFPDALSTCAADAKQVPANAHLDVSVSVDESVSVSEDVSGARLAYSDEFELSWKAYPVKPGASKAEAYRAWKARLAGGVQADALHAGVIRYAAYCVALATDAKYIKLPATFFGPDEHYLSDWTAPTAKAAPGKHAGFQELNYRDGVTEDGSFA